MPAVFQNGTLDAFNDTEGPPMTGWTDIASGFRSNGTTAQSNSGASASGLTGSNYGPNCEAYLTITTLPGNSNNVGVQARLTTLVLATFDGYAVQLNQTTGNDNSVIQRVDNGVGTTLGSSITQNFVNGDGLGILILGSQIFAYRRSAGAWAELGNRTDTTYPNAGSIGMSTSNTTSRLDDFGGGTVSAQGSRILSSLKLNKVSLVG